MIAPFINLMRVTRCPADNTGRREVATERIRISRGPALGGIWKNVRLLNPARNLILGLGRAFQPFQKPARALANALHLPNSFRDAPASEMQEITGARSCLTQGGSHPTYFGSHPTQTGGHPTQNRVSV